MEVEEAGEEHVVDHFDDPRDVWLNAPWALPTPMVLSSAWLTAKTGDDDVAAKEQCHRT